MIKIDFSKFLIQPEKSKSTCQIFVFDLPKIDKENQGELLVSEQSPNKIFAIIEVCSQPTKKINTFINALANEIRSVLTISSPDTNKFDESFFESIVQKINYRYLELIGNIFSCSSDRKPEIPTINALLFFESGEKICLALKGKIFPFLIYRTKSQNYKILNISETASGQEGRTGGITLFPNIISGKINPGDYLLFSTENLFDYFSLEKLCRIISSSNPENSSNELKKILTETANPQTSFASLIIKLQSETQPKTISSAQAVADQISIPQNSMDSLLKTATDTEKMLTPSLSLNLSAGFASLGSKIKNLFQQQKFTNKTHLEYYPSQFTPPSRASKFFKIVILALFRAPYFTIRKIILFLIKLIKNVFYLITNKNNLRKTILQKTAEHLKLLKIKFWQLAPISRILLIASLIFGILFLTSTILLYRRYKIALSLEKLNQKIEAIQNKKSAAEASLIYNDEEGARKTILDAQALLEQFPQKSKDEKMAYENLKKEIDLLQEKIMHIINIEQPILIANLTNQNPDAKVSEFLVSKNNLYAFDDNASIVYKFDLEKKEAVNKNTSGLNLKFGFLQNNNSAIFYQPEKKFFEFDFESDIIREKDVALNENETKINDLYLYNQKLYTLDTTSNQIYKHTPTLVGFARGMPWLKEDLEIQNATSIAIDGSIYLAKSNGEIIKLTNGYKDDFVTNIDPPLSSPTKIWTSADSLYLYILEPSKKRLIVLDKEGKLKNQYFGEIFNDLRDFFVLEKEKKIYLLNETLIFEIIATHLQ